MSVPKPRHSHNGPTDGVAGLRLRFFDKILRPYDLVPAASDSSSRIAGVEDKRRVIHDPLVVEARMVGRDQRNVAGL